jgi:hypothetical protein
LCEAHSSKDRTTNTPSTAIPKAARLAPRIPPTRPGNTEHGGFSHPREPTAHPIPPPATAPRTARIAMISFHPNARDFLSSKGSSLLASFRMSSAEFFKVGVSWGRSWLIGSSGTLPGVAAPAVCCRLEKPRSCLRNTTRRVQRCCEALRGLALLAEAVTP